MISHVCHCSAIFDVMRSAGEQWQEDREVMAGPHAPLIVLRHPGVMGPGEDQPCSQSAADLR